MSTAPMRSAHRRASAAALALVLLAPPGLAAEPGAAAMTAPLIKLVVGLLGVVAALLLLSRVLPRLAGLAPAGHARFRILASLAVGQRERIVLMQAGRRQIVVGVAPGRVNALHVLDEPLEVDAAAASEQGVGPQAWLARTLGAKRR